MNLLIGALSFLSTLDKLAPMARKHPRERAGGRGGEGGERRRKGGERGREVDRQTQLPCRGDAEHGWALTAIPAHAFRIIFYFQLY